jgi:hypothetical protein
MRKKSQLMSRKEKEKKKKKKTLLLKAVCGEKMKKETEKAFVKTNRIWRVLAEAVALFI